MSAIQTVPTVKFKTFQRVRRISDNRAGMVRGTYYPTDGPPIVTVRFDGDDMSYTVRMAAMGQPLQQHLAATLHRQR